MSPSPSFLDSLDPASRELLLSVATPVSFVPGATLVRHGDPVNGLKHIDVMKMFNDDPKTEAVIMVGEIGGSDEENAAQWVKKHMKKPVVGFIAGITAPPGKRMGHAGAIISGGKGTAQEKLAVMESCGIKVTKNPAEMGRLLKSVLK